MTYHRDGDEEAAEHGAVSGEEDGADGGHGHAGTGGTERGHIDLEGDTSR